MNNSKICAIPWVHLNFEPNGKVVPCCLTSTHMYFSGDLTTDTIEEIWNSDNMKKLRVQMMNGEEPGICRKCFDRERVTGESSRTYNNHEFGKVIPLIPHITSEDGTCSEMKLRYWDFRFSNLCNMKCRSCGPRYSSAWVPDAKALGYIKEQDKVWNIEAIDEDTTNYDFLKDGIKDVEKIYFAGGEPLLMKEHWDILDMLVEAKRFDVRICYNTNMLKLDYGKKNAIDYWKQWEFGKIEIWPSIDELGARAELIRSGTVWEKVDANLRELTKYPNITVRPGITVGAWNVGRLPEIIEYFDEIGVLSPKFKHRNFYINLLEYPSPYHVHVLPQEYKAEVIAKLKGFIIKHNTKHQTRIDDLFTHILHELTKPQGVGDARKFIAVTKQMDDLRGESLYATIPEMKVMLEWEKKNTPQRSPRPPIPNR